MGLLVSRKVGNAIWYVHLFLLEGKPHTQTFSQFFRLNKSPDFLLSRAPSCLFFSGWVYQHLPLWMPGMGFSLILLVSLSGPHDLKVISVVSQDEPRFHGFFLEETIRENPDKNLTAKKGWRERLWWIWIFVQWDCRNLCSIRLRKEFFLTPKGLRNWVAFGMEFPIWYGRTSSATTKKRHTSNSRGEFSRISWEPTNDIKHQLTIG